jgi:hypothetical protein
MDYVQRYIAGDGAIQLAPDTRTERLLVAGRYLPFLFVDLFIWIAGDTEASLPTKRRGAFRAVANAAVGGAIGPCQPLVCPRRGVWLARMGVACSVVRSDPPGGFRTASRAGDLVRRSLRCAFYVDWKLLARDVQLDQFAGGRRHLSDVLRYLYADSGGSPRGGDEKRRRCPGVRRESPPIGGRAGATDSYGVDPSPFMVVLRAREEYRLSRVSVATRRTLPIPGAGDDPSSPT